VQVPFFDDITKDGGWQGHTTTKSIETLKSEIVQAISRLGGLVAGFQKGTFDDREGFRIHYTIENGNGQLMPGQFDLAALPVKTDYRLRRTLDDRREQSLKMALYMTRQALDGLWFLQQLSPGYIGLLPWMLETKTGHTFSQLWADTSFSKLLPPTIDFVDGEAIE
jgi:hypothetical protein